MGTMRPVKWQSRWQALKSYLTTLSIHMYDGVTLRWPKTKPLLFALWLMYHFFRLVLIFSLPFLALLRSAIYFHEHCHFFAWFSILAGIVIAAAVLVLYITWIYNFLTGSMGNSRAHKRRMAFAAVVVLAYCLQAFLLLSDYNVKDPALKKEFQSLHPILQLGVSTLILLDAELLLTDASRKPSDYAEFGLPAQSKSLHFLQDDGYAYAVDVRTKGRGWLTNLVTRSYFELMGFNTLRHVGTADHLHVSLPNPNAPAQR